VVTHGDLHKEWVLQKFSGLGLYQVCAVQKSVESEQVGEWWCPVYQAESGRVLIPGRAKGHKGELVKVKANGQEDLSDTSFGCPLFFKVWSYVERASDDHGLPLSVLPFRSADISTNESSVQDASHGYLSEGQESIPEGNFVPATIGNDNRGLLSGKRNYRHARLGW
jgi:hypothetical protein